MPSYLVHQFLNNNIIVFYKEVEYFKVDRDVSFFGKVKSKVYKDNKLILEVKDNSLFFKRSMDITFQDLPHRLFLECEGSNPVLTIGNTRLSVNRQLTKKPHIVLICDGIEVGYVFDEIFTLDFNPQEFELILNIENENNFYLVLLFAISLERQND